MITKGRADPALSKVNRSRATGQHYDTKDYNQPKRNSITASISDFICEVITFGMAVIYSADALCCRSMKITRSNL
jgi:hypothetical protein